MAIKQIPISSLKLGMYVIKLDISWIDSPFMYHHLTIKSSKQVDKLVKAGVKKLSIDTSKGVDVDESATKASDAISENSSNTNISHTMIKELDTVEQASQVEPVKVSIEKEMGVAKALQKQVVKLAEDINESLKNDEVVDAEKVSPLISGTLDSLQRNDQALATLINMQRKDESLSNHAFATFSLALTLSLKLDLPEESKQALALAAFFHDAGWLKLPLNLLGKKTPYTPNEAKLVQQHVAIGHKSLSSKCELSELVMRIIDEHHECIDGSGYPRKLKSDSIHPLSNIFAVVVRYDELVHGLQDKPAVTPHGALAALFKDAKTGRLNTDAVSTLVSVLSVYPVGSAVMLNNKEKAVVIDINHDQPKQPKIKVYYDISGTAHATPKLFDLSCQQSGKQQEIVSVLNVNEPGIDPAGLLRMC